MTQYLVAIHHPDDYDPASAEDEAMHRDIDALNEAMVAAGVRVFVGGLRPAHEARSVRRGDDGTVRVTDGPYIEAKEHIGGFWVLEAATRDEALVVRFRHLPHQAGSTEQMSESEGPRSYPILEEPMNLTFDQAFPAGGYQMSNSLL